MRHAVRLKPDMSAAALLRGAVLALACLAGGGGGGLAQAATYPAGVYVVVDPADTTANGSVTNFKKSEMVPLYGPSHCTGGGSTPLVCHGGIGGVSLSVEWSDFQSAPPVAGGTTSIVTDNAGDVSAMMAAINTIETTYNGTTGDWAFLMTLGLKTGKYAAYDVLDMYTAANGVFIGAAPALGTTNSVRTNSIEGNCDYNGNGNGKNFDDVSGFPEQCVLSKNSDNQYLCTAMPRIFGGDTPSVTNNPLYIAAHKHAQQDLANLVTGVTGYGQGGATQPYPHHFQALKFGGISNSDLEVAVSGNPIYQMPEYTCGYASAADAEHIWTDQQGTNGFPIYETTVMENTWYGLVRGATSVTSSFGDSISYVIDALGDSQFPPVSPEACSIDCIYNPAGAAIIISVTTGEMEHLIQEMIANSLVAIDNFSIQNEVLEYDKPDSNLFIDTTYASGQIPCSLNALLGTSIGYQSAGAAGSKQNYLDGIANAETYGAQYIELDPKQIDTFLNDLTAIPSIDGYTNYGTSLQQNQNLLSIALNRAITAMATNAANSSLGTLCPLPERGGTQLSWDYPYNDPESPAGLNQLLWQNDIPRHPRTQTALAPSIAAKSIP